MKRLGNPFKEQKEYLIETLTTPRGQFTRVLGTIIFYNLLVNNLQTVFDYIKVEIFSFVTLNGFFTILVDQLAILVTGIFFGVVGLGLTYILTKVFDITIKPFMRSK